MVDFRREMISRKETKKEIRGAAGERLRGEETIEDDSYSAQFIISLCRHRVRDLMNWSWE